jgi:Ubiquitin carboxyl-terminal hydrolase, family 1
MHRLRLLAICLMQIICLQEFTADFPSDIRGMTIASDDYIRLVHNSFAAPEAHLTDGTSKVATDDDDVFHFVSYIHRHGAIWELDGLQRGPIKCRECPQVQYPCPVSVPSGDGAMTYVDCRLCWMQ